MGFKYKKEEVTRIEKTIEEVFCDKCKKSLGKEEYDWNGGFFTPLFTWDSGFDETLYERYTVVMCSQCWEAFYDWIDLTLEEEDDEH